MLFRSVTYADGALFCYGENSGDLVVLEATPSGPKQIGSLKLPERTKLLRKSGKAWAHPVIANGNSLYTNQSAIVWESYHPQSGGNWQTITSGTVAVGDYVLCAQ